MTYQRLAYDDAATAQQMTADCHAAARALRRPPSIRFEDHPRDLPKPTLRVSDAAARLAATMHP